MHQRHHDPDHLRARLLAAALRQRAGAHDEVDLDAGLARLPDAADLVRERHALGGVRHGGQVGGELKAGIAWFAVDPKINGAGKVEGNIKKQGYVALANNNLTMPAIAMTTGGKGAIAFTVLGEDYHPSAGYVTIDANGTVGQIHIAAAGLGVDDGFTSYKAFVGDPPVPAGATTARLSPTAARSGSPPSTSARPARYAQYYPSPPSPADFGSCGGTRTSLANWGTRISKLNP